MALQRNEFYAAHNGVAAVYDERGDAIPFRTAGEAGKHGDVTAVCPHNYYLAQRFSDVPYFTAYDRHGRMTYTNCGPEVSEP